MPHGSFRHEWILDKFREFYVELHRQRRLVESAAGRARAPAPSAPEPSPDDWREFQEPYEAAPGSQPYSALLRLLRRQEQDAERMVEFERRAYKKAQYAMVALADDIFMQQVDWMGAEDWRRRPLEQEFFPADTPNAAKEFYERVSRLVESQDPADRAVCQIYFWALALGFEGIYPRSSEMHGAAKRQLLERFGHRLDQDKGLTPGAYKHVRTGVEGGFLPSAWIAAGLLAAAIVVCLVTLVVGGSLTTRKARGAVSTLTAAEEAAMRVLEAEPAAAPPGAAAPASPGKTTSPGKKAPPPEGGKAGPAGGVKTKLGGAPAKAIKKIVPGKK
jgi:type IV/VI secretion system ImpK/VasF family protein